MKTDLIKFRQLKVLFSPDPGKNYELHYEKYSSNYILWFSRSNTLGDAAEIISKEINREIEKIIRKKSNADQVAKHRMAVDMYPIYLMLKGYSLETLLKGCCVLSNEGWEKKFKRHDLLKLAKYINLNFTAGEQITLKHLTRFVEWGGRYPTPTEPAKYKEGGLNDGNFFGKEEFSNNWVIENYEKHSTELAKLFYKVNIKINLILRSRWKKEMFLDLLKDPKVLLPPEMFKWLTPPYKKNEAVTESERTTSRTFIYHAIYARITKEIAKKLHRTKLSSDELASISKRVKEWLREQGF